MKHYIYALIELLFSAFVIFILAFIFNKNLLEDQYLFYDAILFVIAYSSRVRIRIIEEKLNRLGNKIDKL